MSTLIPVGQVRYDFRSDQKQMWDGHRWKSISDDEFNELPIHKHIGGMSIIPNNGITAPVTNTNFGSLASSGITRNITGEEIHDFLKRNLRVAEYLKEDGSIDYVQLELREGEGANWENIQRVRIK
jgi:hypothetical protein